MVFRLDIMKHVPVVTLLLVFFYLALHNLRLLPYPWFDEGWVLSLARNWVVLGHYGYLRLGELIPATILNAGLPVTSPVALSFHYLGIGIWQGRLPSVFFLMGVCALTYHLGRRLYGRKIAIWALVALSLLPMYPDLHPILLGRQALGEIYALFYALAGYALLLATWEKRGWSILLAPLFFALSLQSKPQMLPFLVISLVLPMIWLALCRLWSETRLMLTTFLLTAVFHSIMSRLFRAFLTSGVLTDASGGDLYAMTSELEVLFTYILVADPVFRLRQLLDVSRLLIGLPVLIGIVYTAVFHWRQLSRNAVSDSQFARVLMLWTFVASWFFWFYMLSPGFLRHLFPAFALGSIFAAKAFYDLTAGFQVHSVFKEMASQIHQRVFRWQGVGSLLAVVLLLLATIYSSLILLPIFAPREDVYGEVVAFLNNETSSAALIETYDSELFMMLERDYHYPPDAIQHALNQNLFLGKDVEVDYDPSALEIECVVIGWSGIWPLYRPILQEDRFVLAYENTNYQIYCDRASAAGQNAAKME
jgi:hypothetical protein